MTSFQQNSILPTRSRLFNLSVSSPLALSLMFSERNLARTKFPIKTLQRLNASRPTRMTPLPRPVPNSGPDASTSVNGTKTTGMLHDSVTENGSLS